MNLIGFTSYGFPEVYAAFFTWDPLFFKDLRAQLTPIQDYRHRDRPSDVDPSECFLWSLDYPQIWGWRNTFNISSMGSTSAGELDPMRVYVRSLASP